MKLCALLYRGQVVEVTPVDDRHRFGEHGNHWHLEVSVQERHLCDRGPQVRLEDSDGDT